VPVLTLHPLSGGHGLNLQHGGADLCFFSLPWSLEQYRQTIGRLDRPGQAREVIVHRIIAEGTLDGQIAGALAHKNAGERNLLLSLL
jgi:SNF2 family DNA or RNA helicase